MEVHGHLPSVSDRTLGRLMAGLALVLVIGIPVFAVFYYFDRHPDPGPSLADRAIASAEAVVREQPADTAARNTLAAAYLRAGRVDESVAQFSEVLRLDAENRAALLGRGLAYRQASQPTLALDDFEALVALATGGEMAHVDPQLEQAYYEIGVIQLTQGDVTAAVTALESALRIDSGDADALYAYGDAQITAGNADRGVEALRRAVAFVPTGWCEPYARMADGYRALARADGVAYATAMATFCGGRPAEAAAVLETLQAGPFSVDAWLGLALVSAAQGDPQAAAAFYGKVLAQDPGNASALIGLGQLGGADAHAGLSSPAPSAPAGSATP